MSHSHPLEQVLEHLLEHPYRRRRPSSPWHEPEQPRQRQDQPREKQRSVATRRTGTEA